MFDQNLSSDSSIYFNFTGAYPGWEAIFGQKLMTGRDSLMPFAMWSIFERLVVASASEGHPTGGTKQMWYSTYLQILNLINGVKIKTIASARSAAFSVFVLTEAPFDDSSPSRLWFLLLIALQYLLRFGLWRKKEWYERRSLVWLNDSAQCNVFTWIIR